MGNGEGVECTWSVCGGARGGWTGGLVMGDRGGGGGRGGGQGAGGGARGESDLVRSHQPGRSKHPLPCGSRQLYN